MSARRTMDPDDPERSRSVHDEIAECLVPIEPGDTERRAMRERLLMRVRSAREAARGFTFVRPREPDFRSLMNGVRVLELSALHHAVLLEFAPGASLPVHRHREDEECVVIRGSARIHDVHVQEGDYHLAHAHSRHATVRSDEGALLYVSGTSIGSVSGVLRDMASAWLPGRSAAHTTLRAGDDEWTPVAPGVEGRVLRDAEGQRSMMLRMAAGSRLPQWSMGRPMESIVVAGEAYVGDERADRGDYALIDPEKDAPELSSDSGATLFVRLTEAAPLRGRPLGR